MAPFGLTASFETPAIGGLLRMRAEVANAARARLASSSARPRESGDPELDSRLRGNERCMLRALAISLRFNCQTALANAPPPVFFTAPGPPSSDRMRGLIHIRNSSAVPHEIRGRAGRLRS